MRLLTALLILLPTFVHAQTYTGPCDVASCAEAWGFDYAMTRNYTGPLFQIAQNGSPTTTLDIGCAGANVSGTCAGSRTFKADMTTWAAFCGGDPHNCFFKKIYGQIHGHSNDLVWVNPSGFAN
jgi:hypothetical protein